MMDFVAGRRFPLLLLALATFLWGCPSSTLPVKPEVPLATGPAKTETSAPAKTVVPQETPGTAKASHPQPAQDPKLVPADTVVPETVTRDKGFVQLNFAQGITYARTHGLATLLYVYTPWCGPCKELSRLVFTRPEFQQAGEQWVFLSLDASTPEGKPIGLAYGINSYPTMVVLGPDGQEIERFFGFHNVAEFLEIVDDYIHHRNTASDLKRQSLEAPDDLALAYRAGRELAIRQRGAEALPFLQKVVDADPAAVDKVLPMALLLLGKSVYLEQLREFEKAIATLERLAREFPNFLGDEALFTIAQVHVEQGHRDRAEQFLKETMKFPAADAMTYHRFSIFCLRFGILLDEAVLRLKEAVVLFPEAVYLWKALGDIYMRQGNIDGAIEAMEQAVAKAPGQDVYLKLLEAYRNARDKRKE